MIKDILLFLIPNFDFFFLQCIAISLIAALLPKLKVTSLLGPLATVFAISWFNDLYWDNRLFFSLPNNLSLNVLLLVLANSIIIYVIVKLVPGIEISGLPTAIYTSLLFTLSSYLITEYKDLIDWKSAFQFIESSLSAIKSFFLTTKE